MMTLVNVTMDVVAVCALVIFWKALDYLKEKHDKKLRALRNRAKMEEFMRKDMGKLNW